jgi:two-component system LytT family sensor kinase
MNHNKNILYWLLQIFGWSSYATLIFIASYAKTGINSNPSIFLNLFFSVISGVYLSHLLRNRIISFDLLKIKRTSDFFIIILIVLITSLLYVLLTRILSLVIAPTDFNLDFVQVLINWASFSVLFGFWVALYYGYHLFEDSRMNELDNLLLKASKKDLELQNLRSQLNPHFLFNSLNSIRALVEVNPKKAKEAVNLLSNMLRFSLSTRYDRLVRIENELQMVDAYLNIEKIRFEERLNIKREIGGEVMAYKIPAFSIQTLVENAIKHGVNKLIEGGDIFIRVIKEENFILIQVANSGTIGGNKDLGIGLSNLCKRLDIEYKKDYEFSIYQAELVHVKIRLPANR